MNENTDNSMVFEQDDDWGNIDFSDVAEETAPAEETAAEEAPEADQPTEQQAEEPAAEQTPAQAQTAEADQSFTLKHLDEVRTVGRDEVIALAQKGMDYDRIRQRADEDAEVVQFLKELAEKNGMSVNDFIDRATAAARAQQNGGDIEAVLQQVKLERRERELQKREERLNESAQQQTRQSQADAQRAADIQRFRAAFPDVAPDSIPNEVWQDVAKGSTLTEAYSRWDNKRLREELEVARKNKTNAERSTGSRQSAGAADKQDEFDKLWYSDD